VGAPETELTTAAGCGTERWDVKTLTDGAASQVQHAPLQATVEQLIAMPVPGHLALHTPRFQQEMRVYTVRARLLRYKQENDSDYHIVIAGTSGKTMIVESAAPNCARGAAPNDLQAIQSARNGFLALLTQNHLSPPGAQMKRVGKNVMATFTGVLFFDVLHGQSGVAPNGAELHPLLAVTP